jgi:hypothetical protein
MGGAGVGGAQPDQAVVLLHRKGAGAHLGQRQFRRQWQWKQRQGRQQQRWQW